MERLTPANAAEWCPAADVVIDAADSLALTYILSDECLRQRKPLISASVLGLSGYVGAFCGGDQLQSRIPGDAAPSRILRTIGCPQHRRRSDGDIAGASDPLDPPRAHPDRARPVVSVDFRTLRVGGFSSPLHASRPVPHCVSSRPRRCATRISWSTCVALAEAPVSSVPAQQCGSASKRSREQGLAATASSRVVLCCRSGIRAWRAAQALRRAGSPTSP